MNGLWYEIDHIKEESGIITKCLKEYKRDLYFERVLRNDEYAERSRIHIPQVCRDEKHGRYVTKIRKEFYDLYSHEVNIPWVPLTLACLDLASAIYVLSKNTFTDNVSVFSNSILSIMNDKIIKEVERLSNKVEKHHAEQSNRTRSDKTANA
jgi:hypothetical protein